MMSAAGSIRNKNDSAPAVPGPIVSSPNRTGFEQASWGSALLGSEIPLWRTQNEVPGRMEGAKCQPEDSPLARPAPTDRPNRLLAAARIAL